MCFECMCCPQQVRPAVVGKRGRNMRASLASDLAGIDVGHDTEVAVLVQGPLTAGVCQKEERMATLRARSARKHIIVGTFHYALP